jgi:hypothetical protein
MSDFASANAEFNERAIERVRLLLRRRARWLQERWRSDDCRPVRHAVISDQDLAGALTPDEDAAEVRFFAQDPETRQLDADIDALGAELTEREHDMLRASGRRPAVLDLARAFALSAFGRDVLVLCLATTLDERLGRACAYINDDFGKRFPTPALALKCLLRDTGVRGQARAALRDGAALRRLHLIEWESTGEWPLARLFIDERIADYLQDCNRIDPRIAALLDESAGVPEPDTGPKEIVESLLKDASSWPRVALIGDEDVGIEDVAAAAVGAMGWRLFRIDLEALAAQASRDRLTSIALLGRDAMLIEAAYFVAEPEDEWGEPARAAKELRRALEAPLILRCLRAAPDGLPAVEVARPDSAAQHALWDKALARAGQSLNGAVAGLAHQFDMGPRAIERAVEAAVVRQRRNGASLHLDALDLWRVCREQNAVDLGGIMRRIRPAVAWDQLVLPASALNQLHDIADQVRQRAYVYDGWAFAGQLTRGRGITALFAGESGTGKTMAAEVVARDLELDLYRVDLAGVVSKYIGETEKQLRRVFDAAEHCGAVLLFDEADALFGKRTDVHHSHDRYANIEVNYLLQRMEEYRGIAILATNRKEALDPAFMRRLRFVVEFPFPDLNHRRRMWERVIPAEASQEPLDYGALSRLEISGGHIRNIAVNAAFLAAGDAHPIAMTDLMRAAAREYRKLGRPVGAAEFGSYASAIRP